MTLNDYMEEKRKPARSLGTREQRAAARTDRALRNIHRMICGGAPAQPSEEDRALHRAMERA